MYSCIVDDKVLDFKYKVSKEANYIHNFYIGHIFIGQIFHSKKGWSAVSFYKPYEFSPVYGFKTRYDASAFLLTVNGFWKN